jgi:BMFP domain-containing protein YqiC
MSNNGRQGLDDLAGVAGGFASVLAGLCDEVRAMGKSGAEEMVRRLEVAKQEEVEAAMELARRAAGRAEALEARVEALEAAVAALSARST